jgi:hypothetical protein
LPSFGRAPGEVLDQQPEVSSQQRRHLDGEDGESVEEIAAENVLGDCALEIAVRGCDDADVGRQRREPPTRSNSRSCSTRRRSTCVSIGSSPTSSRKSVPPAASSKRPRRRCTAPVNAPRSWPNSPRQSDWRTAPQLRLTKGPPERRDHLWILCARSFARPCLARDENGGLGRGDLAGARASSFQRGRRTDDSAVLHVQIPYRGKIRREPGRGQSGTRDQSATP